MRKRTLLFIFIVIFIISLSWSFQNFKGKAEKDKKNNPSHQRTGPIKFLEKLQPFRYQGPLYAPGQVLVKFKPSLSIQSIEETIASYQAKKLDRIPKIDVYCIQIPEKVTVEEMVFELSKNPDVEYAEPNYKVYVTATPNDTLFRYQYALNNSGQQVGPPGSPQGKARADIKATPAWEETKGDEEVIIAVLDTGVDLDHPDIDGKISNNGRDLINDDYDADDDHGHGTHVAGIAAAETYNQKGIAGVAWNCKILPVKVLDENGEGDVEGVSEGITWAVEKGAKVINMSFGGVMLADKTIPKTMQDILQYAYEEDVVLVAAAGNDGGAVNWPASSDYCLAIAATNYDDERVTFSNSGGVWESNYGPEIDVAAPGSWIISLWPVDMTPEGYSPYLWTGGTSMSTPHAAGLAALIRSTKPWLKAREIMDVIRFSADDINSDNHPGQDDFIGHGRLNMEKALVPIKIGN